MTGTAMIGTSLSHYRITEKLGQGGMGEVYRAEDTNLSRQVAIKVLPDEFAHDAERLARFQREAEVLACLNHPNIASVYGLEGSGGKRFIVMELVEGQTLAERLLKGPLPVPDALEVCRHPAVLPQTSVHASIPLKTVQEVVAGQLAHLALSPSG